VTDDRPDVVGVVVPFVPAELVPAELVPLVLVEEPDDVEGDDVVAPVPDGVADCAAVSEATRNPRPAAPNVAAAAAAAVSRRTRALARTRARAASVPVRSVDLRGEVMSCPFGSVVHSFDRVPRRLSCDPTGTRLGISAARSATGSG
jgi:hypothetical protein